MLHALQGLMGEKVDVDADHATYTGILREVTETNVTIWTAQGWISIPHDAIKGVVPARQSADPDGPPGGHRRLD